MDTVKVDNVKKDYLLGKITVPALKGVSLAIGKGEFLAIAGPSGSGKTTLLNLIGGLERPTSGSIFIEDIELGSFTADQMADIRARKMGFIFQNFNLLPVLTARENVEYPLLLNKELSGKARRKMVDEAMRDVGLGEFGFHKPMELSGGQRQRVAIARAIAARPAVILADEPTANLDHKTGEDILGLMRELNRKAGITFIFSTHDQKIMDMANRVVRLWDGMVQG
jgi:putative ABC transport system ATP-binding protein